MSQAFRPDPLQLFRADEPSVTNAGDGGLYFNGDLPRSRTKELVVSGSAEARSSRWTGEHGFLSPERFEVLEVIADLIIPSDDHSPGAAAARVPSWLDRLLAASPVDDQNLWNAGMDALDAFSQATHGAVFAKLNQPRQVNILSILAENEFAASTDAERFFRLAKHAVWDLYYRSEIGIHLDLQFKGNGFNKSLV